LGGGNTRIALAAQLDYLRQRKSGFGIVNTLHFAGAQHVGHFERCLQCGSQDGLPRTRILCPELEREGLKFRVAA
jgi:hypothetical protein